MFAADEWFAPWTVSTAKCTRSSRALILLCGCTRPMCWKNDGERSAVARLVLAPWSSKHNITLPHCQLYLLYTSRCALNHDNSNQTSILHLRLHSSRWGNSKKWNSFIMLTSMCPTLYLVNLENTKATDFEASTTRFCQVSLNCRSLLYHYLSNAFIYYTSFSPYAH